MDSTKPLESLDMDELTDWLMEKDIPYEFCKILADNDIDGKEFVLLKPAEVKEMIKSLGIAKKIIRLIPGDAGTVLADSNSQQTSAASVTMMIPSKPTIESPSTSGCSSVVSAGELSSKRSDSNTVIPSHWCQQTQVCIDEKKLNTKARCDIVRTLATLLITNHGPHPTKSEVEHISRQLILKFPFMRDDIGTGYASWYDKILERLRNLRKRSKPDGDIPLEKRKKSSGDLTHLSLLKRYPPRQHHAPDTESVEQHISVMQVEMSKKKPREVVLLPLLLQTYASRRDYITSPERSSVQEILKVYPALTLPSAIEQDMNEIFRSECTRVKEVFTQNWQKYVVAILMYSEGNKKIKFRSDLNPSDAYSRESTAFKVLSELFKCSLSLIFDEIQSSTTDVGELAEKSSNTSPWIMSLINESKFCVIVERTVLCETTSFVEAIFLLLSCHYVFHLSYHPKTKKVLLFLQDYVLDRPDNYETRVASYLAISADIKQCIQ